MSASFFKLYPEKQQRIINAAMKEFARKGYQHASTNIIVREADIGKGGLFHYFKSKKALYLFLCDNMVKVIQEELWERIDWDKRDIFSRIGQAAILKLKINSQYPELFPFILSVHAEEAGEVREELEQRKRLLSEMGGLDSLFQNIDRSKFKEAVDMNAAINMIIWTIEGYANGEIRKAQQASMPLDYRRIIADMEQYMSILRTCFYQEE